MTELSARAGAAGTAAAALQNFYFNSRYGERRREQADICDFTFGNPQEMPLAGIATAIAARAAPHDKDWFAYKTSEAAPQEFLASVLSRELGLDFAPSDIALTAGAFAAISVAVRLLLDAGDEAIYSEPAWFCYEPILLLADAVPRKVMLAGARFDLDLSAIEAAIGPRTRLVIVNTPHNPTGRIYDRATLEDLAGILDRASARYGRRIFLLSDEPYRRLRFDGRGFTSPAAIYPWTLIAYSYGKVLLAPGQRLGYLAISPLMPTADRTALQEAMFPAQMALGWTFPNAVMQYAVPDLETLSIDVAALTRRRDLLVATLRAAGYHVLPPEGTFYLWGRWPDGADADRTWNALADRDVFVMPGAILGAPGWFRICLTASDAMVDRALPAFAAAVARPERVGGSPG
jgi:aspartate aminotransferase